MKGLPADQSAPAGETGLFRLSAAAVLSGVLTGLVGGCFRAALDWAEPSRAALSVRLGGVPWWGWAAAVAVSALAAALARWLVRFSPLAAGSGVQHVEAVVRGEAERAPWMVVPVKFLGGLLAIGGAGLALGREGPTVQMGATIGSECAERLGVDPQAGRDLQAAAAGAGLAVAFNAPLGGAAFVFEELSGRFGLRLAMAVFLACAAAVSVSRAMLGNAPDFSVAAGEANGFAAGVIFLVLGILLGVLGVFYNRTTLFCMDLVAGLRRLTPEVRAGMVGGAVGLVGWFAPVWVGGGDAMNQTLLAGGTPWSLVVVLLALRWVLGPASYAAGTPGGLFAPLLLVGSACGFLAAPAGEFFGVPAHALAVAGMAAFFTGVVRAPLTGTILIVEMTATPQLIVPVMLACFGAAASATALKGPPIYETLRQRLLKTPR